MCRGKVRNSKGLDAVQALFSNSGVISIGLITIDFYEENYLYSNQFQYIDTAFNQYEMIKHILIYMVL